MSGKWMLRTGAALGLAVLGFCGMCMAQQASYALLQPMMTLPDAPVPSGTVEAAPFAPSAPPASRTTTFAEHRFWDRDNGLLFVATAAFSSADFVVTRDNLRSGGQEFNPITRVFSGSTAGLAMNFAGETAGVVGVSYLLHRMRHHKLERVASMVNIGGSAAAVTFGLLHR
jgi:hypothetical protein